MSNKTGIVVLLCLLTNFVLTILFEWHFNKNPLNQEITIKSGFKQKFEIYVPMAQTYEVKVNFSRENHPSEYLQETRGYMTHLDKKGLTLAASWSIQKNGQIIESKELVTSDSCEWSNVYVARCLGQFKIPRGDYVFDFELPQADEKLGSFDTTLLISYNFKSGNTWQTNYMFWSMLFNVFIAPFLACGVLIIFIYRAWKYTLKSKR